MDNSNKNTNLILGIVAVVVLVFVFIYVSGVGSGSVTSGLISGGQSEGTASIGAFLRQISAIKSVNLDTGVFDHNVFNQLTDQSIPMMDEPKGRPNPFAPFKNVQATVSSITDSEITQSIVVETPKNVLSD